MALLADLLPGLAAHAHSTTIAISFTFCWGKTYIYAPIMHRDIGQPFTDAEELPMQLVDESVKDENQGGRD